MIVAPKNVYLLNLKTPSKVMISPASATAAIMPMTILPSVCIGWLYAQLAKALITTTLTKYKTIAAMMARKTVLISLIKYRPCAPIIEGVNP